MAIIDDINRILRDFEKWDAQNPLPQGDPQSGVHHISKADLRNVVIAILQAEGNPAALDTLVSQLANKAELDDSGAIYASRAAAVSAGQAAIPQDLGRIITIEGEGIVFRGPGSTTDQLFSTYPTWGIIVQFQSGPIPLTNFRQNPDEASDPDSLLADVPTGMVIGSNSVFSLVTPRNNAGPVRLKIGGQQFTVNLPGGGNLPVGYWQINRGLILQRRGGALRIIGGDVAMQDLQLSEARSAEISNGNVARHIVFLGDSITRGDGASSGANGFAERAATWLGATFDKFGTSSAQMSSTTAASGTPKTGSLVEAIAANTAAISATAGAWVVIGYGTNDYTTATALGVLGDTNRATFFGAMEEGRAALVAANGSAKIAFITPPYRSVSQSNGNPLTAPNAIGLTLEDYRQAIRDFCHHHNLTVIEGAEGIGVGRQNSLNFLTSGGIHPNNAGHALIGQRVADAIYSAPVGVARSELRAETTARTAADGKQSLATRDAGILPLTNIAGTGNAITADLSSVIVDAGITTLSSNAQVEYIPTATNSAANPSITVGGATYGIRGADGQTWPANGFVVGRSYMLRRRGTIFRVMGGDVTRAEVAQLSSADQVGSSPRLEQISGTANAISATIPAALKAVGVSGDTIQAVTLIAASDNTGPVTLSIDGLPAVDVRAQSGGVLPAAALRAGRPYLLIKTGTQWRLANRLVTQTVISSRSVVVSGGAVLVTVEPQEPSVFSNQNTIIEVLWPATLAWPAGWKTDVSVQIIDSAGAILASRAMRIDEAWSGPKPGSWLQFSPAATPMTWAIIGSLARHEDLKDLVLRPEMTSTTDAMGIAMSRINVVRDPAQPTFMRLILEREPVGSERFRVVVPEDSPSDGVSIYAPTSGRTRTVSNTLDTGSPTGVKTRFRAGDVLTVSVFDNNWYRLHHWYPGGRVVGELQKQVSTLQSEQTILIGTSVVGVTQTGESVPERPYPIGVATCYWHCWSDPTSKMDGAKDMWLALSEPEPPVPPEPNTWSVYSLGDGQRVVFRNRQLARRENPPILGIELRADEGVPIALPMTVGDTILSGFNNGQTHGFQTRFKNFKGAGLWSSIQPLTVSNNPIFSDDFNAAYQSTSRLNSSGKWLTILGGTDKGGAKISPLGTAISNNNMSYCVHEPNFYFPENHFAEVFVVNPTDYSTIITTNREVTTGVQLRATGSEPRQTRVLAYQDRVLIVRGTSTRDTIILTVPMASGYLLRAEAIGEELRVLVNGAHLGTYSISSTVGTGGSPRAHIGQAEDTTTGAQNFSAGPV